MDKSKFTIAYSEFAKHLVLYPIGDRDAMKTLNRGCDLLDKLKCEYWIAAGTLLGLHRDRKILPHDGDLDVDCTNPGMLQEIMASFEKNGFAVYRMTFYDEAIEQIVFADTTNEGILFDLCFWRDRGKTWHSHNDHGEISMPKDLVAIIGTDRMPVDKEAYLEWRYGKNWVVPREGKDWGDYTVCLKRGNDNGNDQD